MPTEYADPGEPAIAMRCPAYFNPMVDAYRAGSGSVEKRMDEALKIVIGKVRADAGYIGKGTP